jgi:SAM-dependent methyltransferase
MQSSMKPFTGNLRDAWRAHADDWAAWASTPDHDVFYWRYNLPAFLELVPEAGPGPTLDVGCGEGRVARALAGRGHTVLGVDAAPPLVRSAVAGDPPTPAAVGDAAALPVRDAAEALVISFMVLQDVDDLDAVLRDLARVLVVGGRLCFAILHPLATAGDFVDDDPESAFVFTRDYTATYRFVETAERDGLTMTFHSEHRSFQTYFDALERAGFVVEALREPVPDDELLADVPRMHHQRRFPWYLHVRARRDA